MKKQKPKATTQQTEKWECVYYQSGTMIVHNVLGPTEPFKYGTHALSPWLHIFGPYSSKEDKRVRDQQKVCEDIRDYLNGGTRPAWLNDMERQSETAAIDLDGTAITATGPMYDVDPPKCNWHQVESTDARYFRAQLMDRLFPRPQSNS